MYKNHPNAQKLGDTVFCDDCLQYWDHKDTPPAECEDPFKGEALIGVNPVVGAIVVGAIMVIACVIALVAIDYLVLK